MMYDFTFKRIDGIGNKHSWGYHVKIDQGHTEHLLLDQNCNLVTCANIYLDEMTGTHNKYLSEIEDIPLLRFKENISFFTKQFIEDLPDVHSEKYLSDKPRYVKFSEIAKHYKWDPLYDIDTMKELESNGKFIDILLKVVVGTEDCFKPHQLNSNTKENNDKPH